MISVMSPDEIGNLCSRAYHTAVRVLDSSATQTFAAWKLKTYEFSFDTIFRTTFPIFQRWLCVTKKIQFPLKCWSVFKCPTLKNVSKSPLTNSLKVDVQRMNKRVSISELELVEFQRVEFKLSQSSHPRYPAALNHQYIAEVNLSCLCFCYWRGTLGRSTENIFRQDRMFSGYRKWPTDPEQTPQLEASQCSLSLLFLARLLRVNLFMRFEESIMQTLFTRWR